MFCPLLLKPRLSRRDYQCSFIAAICSFVQGRGILDNVSLVLPQVSDPIGEALHFLRMSGIFYCHSEFTAPWALTLPPFPKCLMLHVMTSGSCWLEVEGSPNRMLQPGDLALVPHGEGHQMASEPGMAGVKLFEIPREQASDRYETLHLGGGGASTTAVCAVFEFDHPAASHLIKLLPRLIAVDASNSPHADWIESTLRLMAAEAMEMRPGGETVITRLADILVIHAIRSWIAEDPAAQTGWLGALRDKQIGRTIALIHREPARAWTLESLASEAAMSRSAFAARSTELVGEPAMHYVTRWRMNIALTWLREDDAPVGDLSRRLGYESEAAFSRAFKRYMGVSPGAARLNGGSSPEANS
jgi:AraC-like DNA-binding protein